MEVLAAIVQYSRQTLADLVRRMVSSRTGRPMSTVLGLNTSNRVRKQRPPPRQFIPAPSTSQMTKIPNASKKTYPKVVGSSPEWRANTASAPSTSNQAFNVFSMLLGQGTTGAQRPAPPVVDLDSESSNGLDSSGNFSSTTSPTDHAPLNVKDEESDTESVILVEHSEEEYPVRPQSSHRPMSSPDVEVLVVESSPQKTQNNKRNTKMRFADIDCLNRGTQAVFNKCVRRWNFRQEMNHGTDIRICSYNVLCQKTIGTTEYLYRHLAFSQQLLLWENRWALLKDELKRIDADVFCLQEVQEEHYIADFKPAMNQIGYDGFFKKKTNRSMNTHDGCAIFFKADKFKLLGYREVEYFVKHNTNMDKDHIGQIIRLSCTKSQKEIMIANTHLIFNPNRGDIKLCQLMMLMASIDEEMSKRGPCALIMCGDFNIEPQSHVYNYIINSSLFLKGLPRNELSGQGKQGGPCVQANFMLPMQCNLKRSSLFINSKTVTIDPKDDFITHPYTLTSAYSAGARRQNVSTFHADEGNPDFLFYSVKRVLPGKGNVRQIYEDNLHLISYLALPRERDVRETLGPWPNQYVPSDHIPLIADFKLTGKKNQ